MDTNNLKLLLDQLPEMFFFSKTALFSTFFVILQP